MPRMNPEIKKRWVKALRSGKYHQAHGKLRLPTPSGAQSYCCLGVLTDLAVSDGVINEAKAYGLRNYPTDEVYQWAGVSAITDFTWGCTSEGYPTNLPVLNDTGHTFNEIADIIEEQF